MPSKRVQVRDAIYQEIASIQTPVGFAWRTKRKQPILRTPANTECPAFYLFDFQENVGPPKRYTDTDRKLFVIVEYWLSHALNEEPSDALNAVLWEIQKKLVGNNLGGLATLVFEVSSKFKLASIENRVVVAEIILQVDYSTRKTDV